MEDLGAKKNMMARRMKVGQEIHAKERVGNDMTHSVPGRYKKGVAHYTDLRK